MKDMSDASYVIGMKIIETDIEVFWVCLRKSISTKSLRDFG